METKEDIIKEIVDNLEIEVSTSQLGGEYYGGQRLITAVTLKYKGRVISTSQDSFNT
jgi:hypothetical protein